MAETNPTDPNTPDHSPAAPSAAPGGAATKRKRRRWPYVVIGILLLLLILILLIPTIASTAPVRGFVVSKINENFNGKLAVNDWSIGWTSGVTLNGIKIDDERGARVVEISSIRVPMPLLAAARGNYDLGDVVIDKPTLVNVVVAEDGSTNLERLAKPSAPEPPPTEPTELPNVKGKITINDLRGSITGPGVPAPITIEPSNIKIDIPNINEAIANEGGIIYRVGSGGAISTITFAGKVDAIENNKIDLDKLTADQTVTLKDVDSSAIAPFLGEGTTLAGIANGNLHLKASGLKSVGATGKLSIADFAYGGAALSGDTYKSSIVDIPIDVSSADSVVKVTTLKVETDHVLLNVTGQVPQSALENVAANKAPSSAGAIALVLNAKDFKGLSNQLRNTLALQKEVQIDSGALDARLDVALAPQNVSIKQTLDLEAAGTNAGKPVKLDRVHLDTAVTALPTGKPVPDLRDLKLNLTSAFATASGGGKSIDDLNITGNLDLQKLHAQLAQFQQLDQTFAGTGAFNITSKGDLASAGGKSDVSANLALDNLDIRDLKTGGALKQSHIEIGAQAAVARGADENAPTTITFANLSAASADNLFTLNQVEQTPLVVSLGKEATTATGQLRLTSDLKRLLDTLNTYTNTLAPSPTAPGQLQSGNFAGIIKLASNEKGTNVNLDGAIENLTVTTAQQPLTNEKVTIALAAEANPEFTVITIPSSTINSSFANTSITDALLDLNGKALDMLQRAKIQVTIPNLSKTLAVSQAFTPPATQPTTQPLDITGAAVVNLDIARDQSTQTTTVTIPQFTGLQIKLTRANRSYAFDKDINLKISAALAAGEQLDKIDIKQLEGDLGGLATLTMPAPISVTNLSAETPNANGKISLTGAIEPLTRLLSVLQAADPMPYRGDYALAQDVSTKAGQLQLSGSTTINKLIVLGADNQPAFTEDRVVLTNNVSADTNTKTATISTLTLDMPASQAIGLNVKGVVKDWEKQRNLEGVVVQIPHDLEKLWPIIRPLLAPETQQTLADLKLAGKGTWTFNVSGSYPATNDAGKELAFNEAVKSLSANGAIVVDHINTNGIDLTNFELPITLAHGQLATVYGDRRKGERTAKPASFNGGMLDLNSILIDLTTETPRLAIGKNQPLVRGAATNELLMRNMGKYANSLFANADQAQGKLDVTIEYCEFVPLGAALTSDPNARARMLFSLSDMHIVNPIGEEFVRSFIGQLQGVQRITQLIPGLQNATATDMSDAKTFAGRIDQSSITLANGKITQDITMQIVDTQTVAGKTKSGAATRRTENVLMPLTIKGDVSLATLVQNLNVVFPARVIARSIGNDDWEKLVVENFPNGVPFRMVGATSAVKILPPDNLPKVATDWALRRFVGEKTGGAIPDIGKIGDILKPPMKEQPSQTQTTTQPAQPDPVGTLIDIFGKPKEKKDEKKKK